MTASFVRFPTHSGVVYEKLKDVHHYKAKILARVKAKIKGRAKPAVQATPQQALRRSKSVGNGDVELGKKIVERILTEMSQSRGLKLSKVNWMYDSSRMIYWFDFELDGEPKKWQVSYEAITDSVKDKEALRKIERGLAMYVFPDEPGTTVPPPSPKVVPRATRASVPQPQPSALDVFVCHASEDKPFVDQLVTAMKDAGITVWYDTDKLSWGDDLRRSIAMGLLNSRYGIVVLSGAFLARKRWTEHELDGLFAKERGGEKVILPIWHGITADDLAKYNLQFIDKKAMDSSKDSVPAMVQGLKHLLGK